MGRAALLFALTVLAVMSVLVAQPASAATYSLAVDEGECVQVQAGDGSTPAGAAWSMSSATATFQGVVRSSGSYAYGPTIRAAHQGNVPGPGNYFFTACHVCPTGGPITVDFSLPDPPIGGGPQYFPSQDPGDLSDCGSSGFGPGGFDGLIAALGPLGILIAILVLIFLIILPAPAQAQQAPAPPPPVAAPRPQLQPTPWIYAVQEGVPPPPMGGPGPRLVPTPWIGVHHRVPRDAPMQAPPGAYPAGYPFPQGTWATMRCNFCQQITLSPFMGGWFCTNAQCPSRGPNAAQIPDLVSMEWYHP